MDPVAPPSPAAGRWYHGIWFVVFMLFVVLGPLAFPLLWKSPRFSLAAKIALTAAVAVITGWLLVASIDYASKIIHDLQALPHF